MNITDEPVNKNKYRIAAAVLIGGRSKRMGSPKDEMIIDGDGRTFLRKICDEIDSCFPEFIIKKYISVRKGQKSKISGYTAVEDKYDDIGPMGGLVSVLQAAEKDGIDALLLLACDMIRYDAHEIEAVCRAYNGEDILWARTDRIHIQPLASIYSVCILDAALDQILENDHKMRDLAGKVKNVRYFDSSSAEAYININTTGSQPDKEDPKVFL